MHTYIVSTKCMHTYIARALMYSYIDLVVVSHSVYGVMHIHIMSIQGTV